MRVAAAAAVLLSALVGGEAPVLAADDERPTPIVIDSKFDLPAGQARQASVGDVIHKSTHQAMHERVVVTNDVVDKCHGGWCHNFKAGDELHVAGYGPRILCTPTKTGTRGTLFSSYPSYTCVERDARSPTRLQMFGVKELSKRLRVAPHAPPQEIKVRVVKEPFEAYPDWGEFSPPTYVDGQFIAHFAGMDGDKLLLDLEYVPGLPGSSEARVDRVAFTPDDEQMIVLPMPGADVDYQYLADQGAERSTMGKIAGVSLKVTAATPDRLDYQTVKTNQYIQIYPGGEWQVMSNGNAEISMTGGR